VSYAKKDDLIRWVASFNGYESDINTIQTRTTVELVVFVVSLKFFFVEGGEQFIVGTQTAKPDMQQQFPMCFLFDTATNKAGD
jgi:hypothetical protein